MERWEKAGVLSLVGACLAAVAAQHPGLRFVDFVGFSGRAWELTQGRSLANGLYPVGYPALLALLKTILGDVLWAGKLVSVAAGLGLAAAAARWLSPRAGGRISAPNLMMQWSTSEGTDMAAAALSFAGLMAAAERRPGLAGALLGAAAMVRYTAAAALPVGLLLAGRPHVLLGAWFLATSPHWAIALGTWTSALPNQSQNAQMGAPTLIERLTVPWRFAGAEWPTALAGVGLLVGAWKRDRRAWALAGWAVAHNAGLSMVFANERLALPAAVALAAGAFWLVPRRWLGLPALAMVLWSLRDQAEPSSNEKRLLEIQEAVATLPGPVLSGSPLIYNRRDGWLDPAPSLLQFGPLAPEALAAEARRQGYAGAVLDAARARGMGPLAAAIREPPPGWRLVEREGPLHLFAFEE